MHFHSQGIDLLPTTGTPIRNGLRSSWNFLPRRSLGMLVGPTPSKFLMLEGGMNEKLSPQSLF